MYIFYMHIIFVLAFIFEMLIFVYEKFYVWELNNCVCKFDKNKNKNLTNIYIYISNIYINICRIVICKWTI